LSRRARWSRRLGQKSPTTFANGERDFENLCRRDDIDFVYIATPWDWHVPMALAAMNNGKHTGVEVPAAITVAECWQLVDTSERSRRHCVIMENCCYGYNEMLDLNMVRAGQFGELLHGQAAYDHDLRALLFSDSSEGLVATLSAHYARRELLSDAWSRARSHSTWIFIAVIASNIWSR
jgi:predicted dehydrogenase